MKLVALYARAIIGDTYTYAEGVMSRLENNVVCFISWTLKLLIVNKIMSITSFVFTIIELFPLRNKACSAKIVDCL